MPGFLFIMMVVFVCGFISIVFGLDPKQNFKFLLFREDCYNEFLNFNFLYSDCISITISKGLGYAIIIGSSMERLPQVIKLFVNKSSDGIVPRMFYIDSYMAIIVGGYNVHLNNPFSVYGEILLILIQNIAIVLLIWKYNKEVTINTKLIVSLSTALLFILLYTDGLITNSMWAFLLNIQFVMLTAARMPQIIHNARTRSTGQLSLITYSCNTFGLMARFFTLIKETDDLLNFVSTFLAGFYNAVLTAQIIWYWDRHQKVDHHKQSDFEEKDDLVSHTSQSDSETRQRHMSE